mmetsp:Transcript_28850/g.68826  ORF Transcript_28850/g.68826 Transcript_28850/m.68826 type:complete len:132 (-) Transcript_28850:83-478(-)
MEVLRRQLLELQEENKALQGVVAASDEREREVKSGRLAMVKERTERLQELIDTTVARNEQLERDYDKLNAHAKQLTATVQGVVTERKELEQELRGVEQEQREPLGQARAAGERRERQATVQTVEGPGGDAR